MLRSNLEIYNSTNLLLGKQVFFPLHLIIIIILSYTLLLALNVLMCQYFISILCSFNIFLFKCCENRSFNHLSTVHSTIIIFHS